MPCLSMTSLETMLLSAGFESLLFTTMSPGKLVRSKSGHGALLAPYHGHLSCTRAWSAVCASQSSSIQRRTRTRAPWTTQVERSRRSWTKVLDLLQVWREGGALGSLESN
mmetsp:Transcript_1545/g.9511  ORF Transcript_1545/g.9511 Transcript_1545/m.9511 type:complete len:110 (-) Transcript_1545:68-397(-)